MASRVLEFRMSLTKGFSSSEGLKRTSCQVLKVSRRRVHNLWRSQTGECSSSESLKPRISKAMNVWVRRVLKFWRNVSNGDVSNSEGLKLANSRFMKVSNGRILKFRRHYNYWILKILKVSGRPILKLWKSLGFLKFASIGRHAQFWRYQTCDF